MRPPVCSTAMRSPRMIASSTSWVTNTTVLPSSRCRRGELALQLGAHDRVDGAERLVHQQHRRVGGEGPGDADALLLAAGELGRVASSPSPGRGRRGRAARAARALRVRLSQPSRRGTVVDVVEHGAVREQPGLLDDVADAAAQLVRRHRRARRVPSTRDRARRRLDQPVDHPQRRRLAAARRAEQRRRPRRRSTVSDRSSTARPVGGATEALGDVIELDHPVSDPNGVAARANVSIISPTSGPSG